MSLPSPPLYSMIKRPKHWELLSHTSPLLPPIVYGITSPFALNPNIWRPSLTSFWLIGPLNPPNSRLYPTIFSFSTLPTTTKVLAAATQPTGTSSVSGLWSKFHAVCRHPVPVTPPRDLLTSTSLVHSPLYLWGDPLARLQWVCIHLYNPYPLNLLPPSSCVECPLTLNMIPFEE